MQSAALQLKKLQVIIYLKDCKVSTTKWIFWA